MRIDNLYNMDVILKEIGRRIKEYNSFIIYTNIMCNGIIQSKNYVLKYKFMEE